MKVNKQGVSKKGVFVQKVGNSSSIAEATYSAASVSENISNVLEYLLHTSYENVARKQFLSPNTEESAKLLKQAGVRKSVFSFLIASVLGVIQTAITNTFTKRYGIDASEFKQYFDLSQVMSQLNMSSKKTRPVSQNKPTPTPTTSTTSTTPTAPIGEAFDEFDPDEVSWLQTQLDRFEKEASEMTLPTTPSSKIKDKGLTPVDSRVQQAEKKKIPKSSK
jgi:hypothetical protein